MKKILLALVLILPLTGCASLPSVAESFLNLPTGVLTQSVQNPVTPYMLYEIENGLTPVVVGLNVYKRNCWKSVPAGTPAACKNTTRKLQAYTRKVPPLLEQAKTFVANNDQVNAKIVYNEIMKTISDFKSTAAKAGVQ